MRITLKISTRVNVNASSDAPSKHSVSNKKRTGALVRVRDNTSEASKPPAPKIVML